MKSQQVSHLLLEETLFQVDLRTEQLKSFLEKLTSTVNGHTQFINNLQFQLNQALKLSDYEQHLQRTANSLSLRDPEFQQQVQFMLEKPLPENTPDRVENSLCMLVNKDHLLSQAMAFLYRRSKEWDAKVQKLEFDLGKKASKDELNSGLREQKQKLTDNLDDGDKKLLKRIQDLERQMQQSNGAIQQNMNELEKKTLWKISDCEKLLQQRSNEKFVETSCQGVYDRVMRDINKQKEEGIKGIQSEMQDLKAKVQYQDESNQDKFKALRNQLKELQDQLAQKYCSVEKHDQTKQILGDRTLELQNKVAEMTRKFDTVLALEKLLPTIKQMEDQQALLQHREELNRKDIEELKIKLENFDGGRGKGAASDIDPHKMCQLEADIKRLKGDSADLDQRVRLMEGELKRKIDLNEQRFLQQLNQLKQAPQQPTLSKEEVLSIVERDLSMPMSLLKARVLQIVGQACDNSMSFEIFMRNLAGDVADLKKKFELVTELERKMKKQFKQLASNETVDFMKYLQEKANEEDTKVRFCAVDERYKTLADNYKLLESQCKELADFINYLETLLRVNQQETVSILTGNHRVVTQKCLVCGTKNKLTKQAEKSQEYSQAKLYRGDFRPKDSAYENQEVYEVNPNHITLVQDQERFVGTTVGPKYPVIGTRPGFEGGNSSSSGRYLRPQSAQPNKK